MIYSVHNTFRARVYDVDTKQELKQVMQVDDAAKTVLVAHDPIRINAAGDGVETFEISYRAVHPIFGGNTLPQLFHCYGRIEQ